MLKKILPVIAIFITIACVQKTRKRTINFIVDARHHSSISSVGIRGQYSPLSWRETFPLSDDKKDSVYTGSITFDIPFDYVELKFVANDDEYELQDKPNRIVQLGDKDTITYRAVFDSLP